MAPPRTTKLPGLAPLAAQSIKLHFDTATTVRLDPAASTARAPPLLLNTDPVAPHATDTLLLLKMHCSTLKRERATLRAYTAPPPPLVEPGIIGHAEAENAAAEHDEKLESETDTMKS
jgi:hypothetical protein